MQTTHHRHAGTDGQKLSCREAGAASHPGRCPAPRLPAGPFKLRDVIPRLAGRYSVIAPDRLGFSFCAAPAVNH
jgi:hypothetical protein